MTRFLLMLALSFPVMGSDWYAAPGASDSGAGTLANPRSLRAHMRDGFQAPLAAPGDTVWLRGGMYQSSSGALGYLVCNIAGTALSPIKFRAYPGEQPAIVGSANNHPCLDLRGSNIMAVQVPLPPVNTRLVAVQYSATLTNWTDTGYFRIQIKP